MFTELNLDSVVLVVFAVLFALSVPALVSETLLRFGLRRYPRAAITIGAALSVTVAVLCTQILALCTLGDAASSPHCTERGRATDVAALTAVLVALALTAWALLRPAHRAVRCALWLIPALTLGVVLVVTA